MSVGVHGFSWVMVMSLGSGTHPGLIQVKWTLQAAVLLIVDANVELSELFQNSTAGLVFVTAFPDRGDVFRKFLSVVAWETEVWCASDPTHLIHFNGERFLGPYGVP